MTLILATVWLDSAGKPHGLFSADGYESDGYEVVEEFANKLATFGRGSIIGSAGSSSSCDADLEGFSREGVKGVKKYMSSIPVIAQPVSDDPILPEWFPCKEYGDVRVSISGDYDSALGFDWGTGGMFGAGCRVEIMRPVLRGYGYDRIPAVAPVRDPEKAHIDMFKRIADYRTVGPEYQRYELVDGAWEGPVYPNGRR